MAEGHPRLLFRGARLYGPVDEWQPGWLLTEGRQIRWLGPGEPPEFPEGFLTRQVDASGLSLLPGFIDLHVHGAVGWEVMDGAAEGIREMARFYAKHGVTAFLPTTWTASDAAAGAALEAAASVIGPALGGAAVLGVHMEGPYLNPSKTGAQDSTLIRRAERQEALEYLDTGLVRLITLAPEYPENLWLIEECTRRGIAVSAGHTTAGLAELKAAVERGLRHVTHCFNAMNGLGHRDLGTVGAAMALPELNVELIADNIHVHPEAQKILVQVKGPERVILVTDAIRGTGMPDGEYQIDHRTITIKGGEVRLPDGTLAGSVLTMERALSNVAAATGRPLRECWTMSSLNAAREIGVSASKGSLEAGKDADLVLLDAGFEVAMTVAAGEIVYKR
jgi:N-acetylglucosamine-6-phosphate deacetylase